MQYNTDALLTNLQQRTEIVLAKAVSDWQMQSEKQMLFKNESNKWSAAQCIAHLNSYGNYYLPQIEKAIDQHLQTTSSDNFKSSWLGNYFYQTMLPPSTGKPMKKMKSPRDHTPTENINPSEAVADFIDQSEKFLLLLEKARSINISKAKVPISIAKFIKLQLGDVFLFLIAHIERHAIQAEKMLGCCERSLQAA